MLLSGAAWGIYSLQGAGHKVFQGEDVTLTLAEVVKAEPRWNDLPSEISPSVKTTLERCLKKDPKARIRDIGDARLALEGAFESQGVSETATAPRVPGLWLVAVGLFGLLAGFVLSAFRGEEAEARDPKRLVLLPPPDTRIEGFRWREFVISPRRKRAGLPGKGNGPDAPALPSSSRCVRGASDPRHRRSAVSSLFSRREVASVHLG